MTLALVVAAAVVVGRAELAGTACSWALVGIAAYVVGCLVVTVAVNVPLNDRLAAVDVAGPEGDALWDEYLARWVAWNHVRSASTLLATTAWVLVAVGL